MVSAWKAVIAALVIFIAGLATGVVITRIDHGPFRPLKNARHNPATPPEISGGQLRGTNLPGQPGQPGPGNFGGPPFAPKIMGKEFIKVLDHELDLSPDQHERIGKILAEGQEQNKKLWDKIAPEMKKEMQNSKERIREVLTPEQRKRFEELVKRPRKPEEMQSPDRRLREGQRPLPPPEGEPREPQPAQ